MATMHKKLTKKRFFWRSYIDKLQQKKAVS